MPWIKQGRIYEAHGEFGWINSHTQVPTILVRNDCLRVYFSCRPRPGYSVVAMVEVASDDPGRILRVHDKPILEAGSIGLFDEHGVIPNFIYEEDGAVFLVYVGWSRRCSIPYSNWMGIARSDDGGLTFKRVFQGPIFDRTPDDLFSATGLRIYQKDGIRHGWYATGTAWIDIKGQLEHVYQIKHATSRDGITWIRDKELAIKPSSPEEAATCPCVIQRNGRYHMWFSYRSIRDFRGGPGSYRIGYAVSDDLLTWHRDDAKAGINPSISGWDHEMLAYPCLIETERGLTMFYSGNGFGQAGFGYALWKD